MTAKKIGKERVHGIAQKHPTSEIPDPGDRRAGSGTGGLDITGGDAKQMMQADLDNIAKSLAQTIADIKTK